MSTEKSAHTFQTFGESYLLSHYILDMMSRINFGFLVANTFWSRLLVAICLVLSSFSFSSAQTDSAETEVVLLDSVPVIPVEETPVFEASAYAMELPEVIVEGMEGEVKLIYGGEEDYYKDIALDGKINGSAVVFTFEDGTAVIDHDFEGAEQVRVEMQTFEAEEPTPMVPLWLSIVPPLLAILMALVFREVISALFAGIFVGGAIIHVYLSGIVGIPKGLLAVLDTYILDSVADADHVSVILFSMLIGAIVSVISRNGGMRGVVDWVSKHARSARSGQFATWFLGVAIFFDDYANTLVVGNTMRPVTDRLRISREKLSYLVDSTAAPISAVAFITTWIGAELGYIEGGIGKILAMGETLPGDPSAYGIFISSLQYSFYPLMTLVFMLMLIWRNKDFGPMHKAEVRARTTGQVSNPQVSDSIDQEKAQELDDLQPVRGARPNALNAILPIAVVILGTMAGLYYTGTNELASRFTEDAKALAEYESLGFGSRLSLIIGASNSYSALLWSSMLGLLTALGLTLGQKIMKLDLAIDTVLGGFKTMMHAMIILILAWSLAKVTDDLHTADFITQVLGGNVSPYLIPAITFLLAAAVSFSTGSSWGTMAILYPLIIPACWEISRAAGLSPEDTLPLLYNVVACVLAGSVMGDHCSPISDTTILSSLASSCNHIDHVRTQLPYALTVGGVATLVGTIPGAYGVPFYITLPVGLLLLYGIVEFFGKPVPDNTSLES